MKNRQTRCVTALLALCLGVLTSPVRAAEPSPTDGERPEDGTRRRAARARYDRALSLAREGDWKGALGELQASLELHRTRIVLLNMAHCYSMLQRPADALRTYEELERSDHARLTPEERARVAQQLQALPATIGALRLVSNVQGASVHVDGALVGSTPLAQRWLDPGRHSIEVSKEGFETFHAVVEARPGGVIDLPVVLTADRSRTPSARESPAAPPISMRRPRTPPKPSQSRRAPREPSPFYIEGTVGAVAVASWGVTCDSKPANGSTCSASDPRLGAFVGARLGRALVQRLNLEVLLAYLGARRVWDRHLLLGTEWEGYSLDGDVRDHGSLDALVAGLGASYTFMRRTPLVVRLSTGVMPTLVRHSVSGTASGEVPQSTIDPSDTATYTGRFELHENAQRLLIPFVAPEVRFGYQLDDDWSIDLGLAVWVFFAPSRARTGGPWGRGKERKFRVDDVELEDEARVVGGTVKLPTEDALGTGVLIVPTLGARWRL